METGPKKPITPPIVGVIYTTLNGILQIKVTEVDAEIVLYDWTHMKSSGAVHFSNFWNTFKPVETKVEVFDQPLTGLRYRYHGDERDMTTGNIYQITYANQDYIELLDDHGTNHQFTASEYRFFEVEIQVPDDRIRVGEEVEYWNGITSEWQSPNKPVTFTGGQAKNGTFILQDSNGFFAVDKFRKPLKMTDEQLKFNLTGEFVRDKVDLETVIDKAIEYGRNNPKK